MTHSGMPADDDVPMKMFPLFADLNNRAVLIVGGGTVAERKAAALLSAGARIDMIALTLTPALAEWAQAGRVRHRGAIFRDDLIDEYWLVIAATDDRRLNATAAAAAHARRIFVNVVDDPDLCSFHVPAIVDRSPLIIAISSGGAAPMLARLARERLESLLDHSWGPLTELLARARTHIRERFSQLEPRRRFYEYVLRGPIAQLVREQRHGDAQAALDAALMNTSRSSQATSSSVAQASVFDLAIADAAAPSATAGSVILVGAGPGDPGLLTLNALRALNEADVILHDRLVSAEVMELARRDAERIDVGKLVGKLHMPQSAINALMVEHAQRGKKVVRIKGGDPFIFGRGGEEIEYLREHGIAYSIVPGITAAIACAAYAGVPLTHRDHAQVVRFATAHRRRSEGEGDELTAGGETLAIYMGVAEFANVRDRLYEDGISAGTPFAIVENGTRPEQRVLIGILAELVECAAAYEVHAPALLIVGAVAELAATQHWFGAAPLSNADFAAKDATTIR